MFVSRHLEQDSNLFFRDRRPLPTRAVRISTYFSPRGTVYQSRLPSYRGDLLFSQIAAFSLADMELAYMDWGTRRFLFH